MTPAERARAESTRVESARKPSYHHGNLAQTLVNAATQLVAEDGPEHFSLADASRVAGVSKGAPYRHFENKEALLSAVVDSGFDRFADLLEATVARYPKDEDERVTAIGLAYIQFATTEPAIFKLMFSDRSFEAGNESREERTRCFKVLLRVLSERTGMTDHKALLQIARPLWTLVHGASMLTIDSNYQRVDPDGDTEQMIRAATELILAPYNS